jgi:uncharacterized protein (TIGR02231 family)
MKSKLITALIIFSSVVASNQFASALDVKSRVEKVTLFSDRALVERVAVVSIPAGETAVRVVGIPGFLDYESLRVSGVGSAKFTIGGVDFASQPTSGVISERANQLRVDLEKAQQEASALKKEQDVLKTQRRLVSKIKLDLPEGGEKARPRTAQEMKEIIRFVGESSSALTKAEVELEKREQDLNNRILLINRELSEIASGGQSEVILEVPISAPTATEARLTLSYQTSVARWYPSYTLYATKNDGGVDIDIEIAGMVTQKTGEDWKDVDLILSTARPSRGLDRPQPFPLSLNEAEVHPLGAGRGGGVFSKSAAPAPRMEAMSAPADAMGIQASEELAEFANIPGVVAFRLPKKISISGQTSDKKIKVQTFAQQGQAQVVTMPYLVTDSFEELKAVITDMPLLPATMKVVNNGTLVGSRVIPYIPKGGELDLPLGVADDVQVSRNQIKKYQDDPGIIRSFKRIVVEYEIEVRNLGDLERKVLVLERGIISQNEKIKVALSDVKPEAVAENSSIKLIKTPGVWEWNLNLKPKETQKITYKATVEMPADMVVPGLDTL